MFKTEIRGNVAVVRFDNAPVNAVSFEAWESFPALIASIEAAPEIDAIVLTGLPNKHFCAGNDRREFNALQPEQTDIGTAAVRNALRAVYDSRLPAIAAMHGAAMGSGMMLCCCCDIRIAERFASMGIPEVKVGAFGGYRLVREVAPIGEARYMAYSGDPISAERAYQLGVVQELIDGAEATFDRALDIASHISGLVQGRLREHIKGALREADAATLWDGYEVERSVAVQVMGADRRNHQPQSP